MSELQMELQMELQIQYDVEPSAPPAELVLKKKYKTIEELKTSLEEFNNIISQLEELLNISNLTETARNIYTQHLIFCKTKFENIKAKLYMDTIN
jgi:hypothetical protein